MESMKKKLRLPLQSLLQSQSTTLSTNMAINVQETVNTRVFTRMIAHVIYRGQIVTYKNGAHLTELTNVYKINELRRLKGWR